jgi:hypothetical protein
MIPNKKAESLAWILIWIMLLTFVVFGLYNLILYSVDTNLGFEESTHKWFLEDNTLNILYKINTDGISEWSGFYIYKDNVSKTFEIFTGASNIQYKYINEFWEKVDTGTYEWNIYGREAKIEKIDSVTNSKIYSVLIEKYYKK